MAVPLHVVVYPKRARATLCLLIAFAFSCASEPTLEPRINSVQPNRIPFGVSTTCTIVGQNFHAQLRIEVDSANAPVLNRNYGVWLGAQALPKELVTPVNTTTIAFVTPSTLAVGLYDVKLQTPKGRWATLPNALTVVAASTSSGGAGNSTLATTSGTGIGSAPSSFGGNTTGFGGVSSGGTTSSIDSSGTAGWDTTSAMGGTGQSSSTTDTNAGGASDPSTSAVLNPTGGTLGTSASVAGVAGTTNQGGAGGSASGGTAGRSGVAGAGASAGNFSANSANAGVAGVAGVATTHHVTMWTDGNVLRDTCDQVVVLRGVQQILGKQLPPGNDWAGLMDEIAATGANAVRIQVETATLSLSDVAAVVASIYSHNMISIVSPDSRAWYSNLSVASSLAKYRSRLIFDGYYPSFDDRTKFLNEAKAAIAQFRGYGYIAPLLVSSNAYGRDLPAALSYGAELVAADPVHNIVIGWDAYWGDSGTYQTRYGMSLPEGIAAAAGAAVPVMMGLTLITDSSPNQYLDYDSALTAAQANGLGWVWWDYYNPYGTQNNLSADGTGTKLTTAGQRVVNTHPAGLAHTATWGCAGQ